MLDVEFDASKGACRSHVKVRHVEVREDQEGMLDFIIVQIDDVKKTVTTSTISNRPPCWVCGKFGHRG